MVEDLDAFYAELIEGVPLAHLDRARHVWDQGLSWLRIARELVRAELSSHDGRREF